MEADILSLNRMEPALRTLRRRCRPRCCTRGGHPGGRGCGGFLASAPLNLRRPHRRQKVRGQTRLRAAGTAEAAFRHHVLHGAGEERNAGRLASRTPEPFEPEAVRLLQMAVKFLAKTY